MKATWKASKRKPLRVERRSGGPTLCFQSRLSCRFESRPFGERFTPPPPPLTVKVAPARQQGVALYVGLAERDVSELEVCLQV